MRVVRQHISENSGNQQFKEHQAQVALAAALVHDVGHGMFSHAFETVGKSLGLRMAQHETVSEEIIRNTEIASVLTKELGSGFANDVADLIGRKEPGNLYDSVVSSQFDADRLDYMQRDRMMTGVQSSGIDLTWLLANLQVASVSTGADEDTTGSVETLVLGPKAIQTAESYVLSLFHLYPNVYLHKTTRGAEKVFGALMQRLLSLGASQEDRTGLPLTHPIIKFAKNANELTRALELDDAVFWGALPMLVEARDKEIQNLALCLKDRLLPECIDIRRHVERELLANANDNRVQHHARATLVCTRIETALKRLPESGEGSSTPIFLDRYDRAPYKRYQDSDTPLNRILLRSSEAQLTDMADLSPVIAAAETFSISRAYVFRGDTHARELVENTMRTEIAKGVQSNA
ncbi:metal dependent phosphohydrolase [Acetobacter nitrogenifigens DSM 23921 = NBRC 105050]|nr:metal dependent phosphohydrolase [Acetobacter nitrogenifigens DSM 23921 = NBRC 105050]